MIGLAAIPWLASAAPPPNNSPNPIDAFVRVCLPADPGATAATIMAQADAAGWRHTDGAPASADKRTASGSDGAMDLGVDDTAGGGEVHEACAITLHRSDPALIATLQSKLGFAPGFDVAGSATFFALRTAQGWRNGKGIDTPAFVAAKKAGNFFSLMILGAAGQEPVLMALHVLPGST
jgi:hypothetical protein